MNTAVANPPVAGISAAAACRRLGCGRRALMMLVDTGRLSMRRVGTSYFRFNADEVDALVEQSTRRATPPAN